MRLDRVCPGFLRTPAALRMLRNSHADPPSRFGCHVQRRLGLKDNQLEELPEAIGGLTALVELFITNNKLRQLPASMASLTSLVKLQVCRSSEPITLTVSARLHLADFCSLSCTPAWLRLNIQLTCIGRIP